MTTYPERRSGRLTGKWITEVTENGERRRKRFDTQSAGQRWEDHIKLTGAPPPEIAAGPQGLTVSAVAQEAKGAKDTWRNGRDLSVLQRLETVVGAIGPDKLITDVTTKDLDKVVTNLRRRPGRDRAVKLSAATINRYLTAASALLTFAVERGYRQSKPTVPWQKAVSKRIHWLTEDVEQAVCESLCAGGYEAEALTVNVLAASGLRWGEFEGLTASQVVGEWIKLDKTKTNRPRDVPLDPQLATELRAMLASGTRPDYYTFRKRLKAALKSAGQSPEVGVHSLRHTTGTRLMLNDVNLAVAKDFLGHSDVRTTLKYTHVTQSKLQEAARKLTPRAGQTAKEPLRAVQEPVVTEGKLEATAGIEPAYTVLQTDR